MLRSALAKFRDILANNPAVAIFVVPWVFAIIVVFAMATIGIGGF